MRPEFKDGERVGILKGEWKGKKGTITKVGHLYVTLYIQGVEGFPYVKKDYLIRVMEKADA